MSPTSSARAGESAADYARWSTQHAFDLEDRFELSFWDALIVAAAAQAQCRYLLTEDLQDSQDFDGVIVVDPFRHAPTEFELHR